MNTTRTARLTLVVLLTLVAACDGGSGGGNAPAGGGGGGATPTPAVATVSVTPDTWNATRFGQRQQLTATAMDASGNPILGKEMTWESSNPRSRIGAGGESYHLDAHVNRISAKNALRIKDQTNRLARNLQ